MAQMGKGPPKCIEAVFDELANGKDCINAADLAHFLVSKQGESCATEEYAAFLISQFHEKSQLQPSSGFDSLILHEFLEFLLSPELNSLMQTSDKPTHDMTAPLSHYLIYASHNSYLTGNQLTSKSGTAMIEKALQAGCRVVELDCWERKGEIMVLHGHTLTKPVRFDDCLRAIKENAFVTSDYPVIITIENHLPLDIQEEAARMIRDILGDTLFVPSPDERPPRIFASPENLKHKIIVSDTPPKETLQEQAVTDPEGVVDKFPYIVPYPLGLEDDDSPPTSPNSLKNKAKKGIARQIEWAANALFHHGDSSDRDSEQRAPELEELIYIFSESQTQIQDDSAPGLLVSGERSIMANFSEPQLKKLVKSDANSLIKYTENNLGRMYPFGLRFNSSNPDPFLAWAHGFQIAALNIQGQDRPCWITQALFDGNGKCGFVKKPPVLLPSSDMTLVQIADMVPKLLLKVKILMGADCHKAHTFLKQQDLYVKISIDGFPSDKAKKKTDTIQHGEEPNWEHQMFQFLIRVPEIAVLRLELWDHDTLKCDNFIGQACFSVAELRIGVRAAGLRSRDGEAIHSKLLCWTQIEEWVASEA